MQKSAIKSVGGKIAGCLIHTFSLFAFYLPETHLDCYNTKCLIDTYFDILWYLFFACMFSTTVLVKGINSYFVMYEKTKHPLILFFPKTLIFDPSQEKPFVIKVHFSGREHQTDACSSQGKKKIKKCTLSCWH